MCPDMPTCLLLGIHPLSTIALEQQTMPPSFLATDSATSMSDLSRMPSPRDINMSQSSMPSSSVGVAVSDIKVLNPSPLNCQYIAVP